MKLVRVLYQKTIFFFWPLMKENISSTESVIAKLNDRIKELLCPYDNILELLKKVPGINTKSVEDLVAEIGLNMSVFPNEKHLASWGGVCFGNNESAGKKSGRIAVGHLILKSVYHSISGNEEYKELGADYVLKLAEAKRTADLAKELEKLGYEIQLNKLDSTG